MPTRRPSNRFRTGLFERRQGRPADPVPVDSACVNARFAWSELFGRVPLHRRVHCRIFEIAWRWRRRRVKALQGFQHQNAHLQTVDLALQGFNRLDAFFKTVELAVLGLDQLRLTDSILEVFFLPPQVHRLPALRRSKATFDSVPSWGSAVFEFLIFLSTALVGIDLRPDERMDEDREVRQGERYNGDAQ